MFPWFMQKEWYCSPYLKIGLKEIFSTSFFYAGLLYFIYGHIKTYTWGCVFSKWSCQGTRCSLFMFLLHFSKKWYHPMLCSLIVIFLYNFSIPNVGKWSTFKKMPVFCKKIKDILYHFLYIGTCPRQIIFVMLHVD